MALVLAALMMGGALLAIAPAAEARQVCTYNTGEPCDDQLVCAYDQVTRQWHCFVHVDPCWFRCW